MFEWQAARLEPEGLLAHRLAGGADVERAAEGLERLAGLSRTRRPRVSSVGAAAALLARGSSRHIGYARRRLEAVRRR